MPINMHNRHIHEDTSNDNEHNNDSRVASIAIVITIATAIFVSIVIASCLAIVDMITIVIGNAIATMSKLVVLIAVAVRLD